MSTPASAEFTAKWRARWPEWVIVESFVPRVQRDVAVAWLALLQELADAAWAGDEPAPGLAKLAWWQEELRGWSKGVRRHPLGTVLQARSAHWGALADAMGVLRDRDLVAQSIPLACERLVALDEAASRVEADLFDAIAGGEGAIAARIACEAGVSASPDPGQAAAAWGVELTRARAASRVGRLHQAVLRERLDSIQRQEGWRPGSRWRLLWRGWHSARN